MEIQQLRLLVTEADINALVARALANEPQVRDVKVALTPEGIRVSGVYPTAFMSVRFETLWSVAVEMGKVAAALADLKVVGLPVGLLKPTIMAAVSEALAKEESIQVMGDRIQFDLDKLLHKNGVQGKTNLTRVSCNAGSILIEAGNIT